MSNANKRKGICLGHETTWIVDDLRDLELFFRHLRLLFPNLEALLYFEGVSISPDVRDYLEKYSVTGWHEVMRGTIYPEPSIFHVPATQEILNGLADLASCHAYSEMADHCHVYTKERMILQWYDACDPGCPFGVSANSSEENVRAFCKITGASYKASIGN